jgi:hypothetical protein
MEVKKDISLLFGCVYTHTGVGRRWHLDCLKCEQCSKRKVWRVCVLLRCHHNAELSL